jgi:hypothetical protein
MKELLTLKEAASLAGKTTKTIKNYIKRGTIKNFFLVEGKYGQEYRISLKDVEPLMKQRKSATPGKKGGSSPGTNPYTIDNGGITERAETQENIYKSQAYQFLLRRSDELVTDLESCRNQIEALEKTVRELRGGDRDLEKTIRGLRQELEEKDMLISVLMSKKSPD